MKNIFQAILILASIISFFTYTNPKYQEIKLLKDEKAQYDEALLKAKELRKVRDTLTSSYNTISDSDKDRIQKMLPDNVDNVRVIIDVNSLARKYGMAIKNIKNIGSGANTPNNTNNSQLKAGAGEAVSLLGEQNKKYGTATMGFSVTSDYDSFLKFLSGLEKSLRIIDITDITFNSADTNLYDYSIGLKTYWLK